MNEKVIHYRASLKQSLDTLLEWTTNGDIFYNLKSIRSLKNNPKSLSLNLLNHRILNRVYQ